MAEGGSNMEMWKRKWNEGQAVWHSPVVDAGLLEFSSRLDKGPGKRAFVPLCGKAVEMKWFYDEGCAVVAVEMCEEPILDFFRESKILYDVEDGPNGRIYKSRDDKRITIYASDLFTLDTKDLGKFEVIWDRGALVAIEPENQKRYIEIMTEIMQPNGSYMLVATTHLSKVIKFPRSISQEAVKEAFGKDFTFELLRSYKAKKEKDLMMREELKGAYVHLVLLTKK